MNLVVVGDTLLDADLVGTVGRVCPDAPVPVVDAGETRERPGGAGLAAAIATRFGPTTLITALAPDEGGARLAELLGGAGVTVVDIGAAGSTAHKLRVRVGGQSLLRIDRGGGAVPGAGLPDAAVRALAEADGVLVADYGGGVAAHAGLRRRLQAGARRRPLVWDPHPRGPAPIRGAWLTTPNAAEATGWAGDARRGRPPAGRMGTDAGAGPRPGGATQQAATMAAALRTRWGSRAVVVTCGPFGAVLAGGAGAPLVVQPPSRAEGDSCGAGDCFAVAALAALCGGRTTSEAVEDAVMAAARFVAEGARAAVGPASEPTRPSEDAGPGVRSLAAAERLVRATQADGGTVVVTSGCFDLLHPGHVHVLDQARRLGDLLVVLVNSDESVRRLKGPARPIQPEQDRAAVLAALGVVDAVVVFGEDTPAEALRRLRPDLFAKGGDYFGADLPEAAVMSDLGGQAVVLSYLAGRSTTRLVAEATRAP
jgi:rfaE bifunctional protein nucleotidyltransferase chain/domain